MRCRAVTYEGHILADLDGRTALIDTGCPVSLGHGAPLVLGGRVFPLIGAYYDFRFDDLRRLVGCDFDLVVGMDAMAMFDVRFSVRQGFIDFDGTMQTVGRAVEISTFYGVPIMPIEVDGSTFRVIFDTGAPLSYLVPEAINRFPSAGRRWDFFPGKGRFDVLTRRVGAAISDKLVDLCIGEMENPLREMLEPAGVPGILGTGILTLADVTLSMRRGVLVFSWNLDPNVRAT